MPKGLAETGGQEPGEGEDPLAQLSRRGAGPRAEAAHEPDAHRHGGHLRRLVDAAQRAQSAQRSVRRVDCLVGVLQFVLVSCHFMHRALAKFTLLYVRHFTLRSPRKLTT